MLRRPGTEVAFHPRRVSLGNSTPFCGEPVDNAHAKLLGRSISDRQAEGSRSSRALAAHLGSSRILSSAHGPRTLTGWPPPTTFTPPCPGGGAFRRRLRVCSWHETFVRAISGEK